jgi:WD40 repeat protein
MNTANAQMFRSVLLIILLSVLMINTGHAQETPQTILNRPPLAVLDIQYSPDGRYLARVYAEGRLEVLDTSTNLLVLEDSIELPNSLERARVDWSPSVDRLAAGIGAQVYIWDVANWRLLETVQAGRGEPLVYFEDGSYIPEGFVSLQWDSTGTLLMAQSVSSRYTVWSTDQQAFIVDQVIGNNPVPIVWLADDRHISNGDSVFDIYNQTPVFVQLSPQRLTGVVSNCGPYSSIASNSDRTQIVRATIYRGYQITPGWPEGISGIAVAEYMNPIWDVSWSPDDRTIIAVDSLGAVRVVHVATGMVTLIAQQDGPLYVVDWADDNSAIAYGGNTQAEAAIFATVSVAEVEQLMATEARQPEFAITPATDR